MIVNLVWALKIWPGIWKCLSQGGLSVLQTSVLYVLILKFKLYLDFPTFYQLNYIAAFTSDVMSD